MHQRLSAVLPRSLARNGCPQLSSDFTNLTPTQSMTDYTLLTAPQSPGLLVRERLCLVSDILQCIHQHVMMVHPWPTRVLSGTAPGCHASSQVILRVSEFGATTKVRPDLLTDGRCGSIVTFHSPFVALHQRRGIHPLGAPNEDEALPLTLMLFDSTTIGNSYIPVHCLCDALISKAPDRRLTAR
ncbi:hypothetical protein FA95DRAFT_218457 [Auriscalpium vulgare]|uniref:Uncharacterized protein n=1 Tax=Auriscalpium vulgare TaxID=40419 RepID=A0ACB8RMR5_9AGAM|nr:hypothetical protein FA95DRAFT_218457 [Auriscalpium vulgare]